MYKVELTLKEARSSRTHFAAYSYLSFNPHGIIPLRHVNPLNAELNPICHLLALLGAHHFLHVNRTRVKSLTFRLLMSYICIYIYIYMCVYIYIYIYIYI